MPVRPLRRESSPSSLEDELRGRLEAMRALTVGEPIPYRERKADLEAIRRMLLDNSEEIIDALQRDFRHRARGEVERLELLPSLIAVRHAKRKLRSWMRPERRVAYWASWPSSIKVVPQPLGVVGVVSPWNYPVLLTIGAVIGAIAAGNRVMIKMSESCPAYTKLFARLVSEYFPPEKMLVVEGGPEVASVFSSLPFDHILFTGSTSVGRLVLKSAAENLTPVTLELGGKSPALIDRGFEFRSSQVGSLLMGKLYNAGQTCVAPDYLLVHEGDRDRIVEDLRVGVRRYYSSFADNDDYTAIINDKHHARLSAAVEDARSKGATIVEINPGNEAEENFDIKLPLTLVLDVTDDMIVAQEEIFGPILPIHTYATLDDAIAYVNARPRPLASYIYSRNRTSVRKFREHVVAGALGVNQTAIHVGIETLPFGGVGASGMGSYHGYEGFVTFSHMKAIYRQLYPNFLRVFAPPYEHPVSRKIVHILMRL